MASQPTGALERARRRHGPSGVDGRTARRRMAARRADRTARAAAWNRRTPAAGAGARARGRQAGHADPAAACAATAGARVLGYRSVRLRDAAGTALGRRAVGRRTGAACWHVRRRAALAVARARGRIAAAQSGRAERPGAVLPLPAGGRRARRVAGAIATRAGTQARRRRRHVREAPRACTRYAAVRSLVPLADSSISNISVAKRSCSTSTASTAAIAQR